MQVTQSNIKPSGYLISDIFNEAGQAFTRMACLTRSMKDDSNMPPGSSKWSQADINKFYSAVKTFSTELNNICSSLDSKIREEIYFKVEKNILTESGCEISEPMNLLSKSTEPKDTKSEEHSPDYIDPDDEGRENYYSEDDNNYELE